MQEPETKLVLEAPGGERRQGRARDQAVAVRAAGKSAR